MQLWLCELVSGTISGVLGAAIGHPMDTIKTRMQISGDRSVLRTISSTFRYEGVPGFLKGFFFPVLSSGVLNAMFFAVYGQTLRQMIGGNLHTFCCEEPPLSPVHAEGFHWKVGVAGFIGGAASTAIGCPAECIKTKQQGERDMHLSSIPAAKLIYKKQGASGLFCGFVPMVYRNGVGFSAYVITYEHVLCILEEKVESSKKRPSVFNQFVSGGIAGCAFWALSMPFDVIKSRIQFDDPDNPKYRGTIDCFRQSFKAEGYSIFFSGLGISMLRSIPVNAVIFVVYEYCLSRLLMQHGHLACCEHKNPSPYLHPKLFICGMVAGISNVALSCPTELIKTRLQIHGINHNITLTKNFAQVYNAKGRRALRNFYHGAGPMCLRDGSGFGAFVVVQEHMECVLRQHLKCPPGKDDSCYWVTFLSGGIAGVAHALVGLPFDVIKTRLMVDRLDRPVYSSSLHCFSKTRVEYGLRFFYHGGLPATIRGSLIGSLGLVLYEWAREKCLTGLPFFDI